MRSFIALASMLSRAGGVIAIALLAASILVVCHMIVLRYVLNASTIWQTEFVTYGLTAATFLASPYVLMLRGHVSVDLLQEHVGSRWRLILQLICAALSMLFIGLLGYSAWVYFHEALSGGWTTETVWALPLWIPLLPFPLGMALLFLQYIAEVLRLLSGEPLEELAP